MAKKILFVGVEVSIDDIQYCNFDSDTSLLDWDVILFKPSIDDFCGHSDYYQGKPSLSDSNSFRLKERSEHWRREINDAVESGKTVIVFLAKLDEVFIDSGRREYSGTGRNQRTTRIVERYDNYCCIPARINPVKSKGSAMKLSPTGAEVLAPYWNEFEECSNYKVVLNGENIPACISTKKGDKTVGAIYKSKNSTGALILVPDIDFYQDDFLVEKDDEDVWTNKAKDFATRILTTVLALDKALKNEDNVTPEPEWAKEKCFELIKETEFKAELLKIEEKLENLQSKKETLKDNLKDAGRIRNLLFEKGKPLEYSIIDALKILGFEAAQYKDSESEFDVVFKSKEGRLIGEAEGKDNKAVNIDKLRQLEMNIHEDLDREEIDEPAKAVLFGNAFRLEPIDNRKDPFTTKCISAAIRSSTALVQTPELFIVVRYFLNNRDSRFATKCRKAILNSIGLVEFPKVPQVQKLNKDDITEKES